MRADQAPIDIRDAINAGFDGFALNTHTLESTDQWNLNTIQWLLDAAQGTDFKLFLSFDMSWGLDTKRLGAFLTRFSSHESYYKVDGRPFVSTFWGGNIPNTQWDADFIQPLVANNSRPFFVPDFDDWSGWPNKFFNNFPSVDGAFSWEAAWPAPGTGQVPVSDSVDRNILAQAQAAGKAYMMRMYALLQSLFPGSVTNTFSNVQHCLPFNSNGLAVIDGTASAKSTSPNACSRSWPCSRTLSKC
jgi:glucan endo-1,3-alpha-glucosidase